MPIRYYTREGGLRWAVWVRDRDPWWRICGLSIHTSLPAIAGKWFSRRVARLTSLKIRLRSCSWSGGWRWISWCLPRHWTPGSCAGEKCVACWSASDGYRKHRRIRVPKLSGECCPGYCRSVPGYWPIKFLAWQRPRPGSRSKGWSVCLSSRGSYCNCRRAGGISMFRCRPLRETVRLRFRWKASRGCPRPDKHVRHRQIRPLLPCP